jgi:glycosyltransferase involved in cell wall biosynthesis
MRRVIGLLLRRLINRRDTIALVQNPDDRAGLLALGLVAERIELIPGSGVDVQRLKPLPEPSGPPGLGFVGRLLEDKGIRTLIAAHRLLRQRGSKLVAGTPDPANPASVSEQEAAAWGREPGVRMLGHVGDIAGLWARASIAVLPSRREGLPKSLLEAAACGRPSSQRDRPAGAGCGCGQAGRGDRDARRIAGVAGALRSGGAKSRRDPLRRRGDRSADG